MAALIFDAEDKRFYETGIDHGVLFLKKESSSGDSDYEAGVAWNGLTSVNETPSGAEDNEIWADNIKYLTLTSAEDFGLTIECVTYPDEWYACDGSFYDKVNGVILSQQARRRFGLAYRTKKGNANNPDLGYILHLVYNCSASTSDRSYSTVNDSPEAITFSYECKTIMTAMPTLQVDGNPKVLKPAAIIRVDSTINKAGYDALCDIIYGRNAVEASTGVEGVTELTSRLPKPSEVFTTLGCTVIAA